MSKKVSTKPRTISGYLYEKTVGDIEVYKLKSNDLRVLYLHRPDTGTVTNNLTYLVGARDEVRGETGLAHMLEHMLFKPTKYDNQHRIKEGSAMHFERVTGAILNANTWKDRTTYYFSAPTALFDEMLRIEADRIENVVLTDDVFKPEQGNVLSEYDMYNGDPHFALAEQMCSTAYLSHPYGHETLGYREDIEDFTAEKLERFYRNYYRPDNATLMVVGDVDRVTVLEAIKKHFAGIKNPNTPIPRHTIREPKQEGTRRITIERPSTTNIVSIGFKHPGFPSKEWFTTQVMLDVIAGGPESILHKLLVDTGRAASADTMCEPTSEENLGTLSITLSPTESHATIEADVLAAIEKISQKDITALVTKAKANMITDELFGRTDSLKIVNELTEYVAARDLEAYTKTAEILASITPKDVFARLKASFINTNLTIGYFIGKQ